MIYLVSATPGTGKTCWVVKQLLTWIDDPANKDRKIYANIAGLKIEGVDTPPDDFRKCPDGSIIVYDEAQEIEHYSSDSRANNPIAKALSKHRHRGFDIWFISQDPSLLHKYVLKNVYLHYYMWRPAQRKSVEIFTFARAIVSPTSTDIKNAYDKRWWRFEPKYLDYYTSTVLNTSKRVYSNKIIGAMITGLIFTFMIGFFVLPVLDLDLTSTESKPDDEISTLVQSDTTDQSLQSQDLQVNEPSRIYFIDELEHKYLPQHIIEMHQSDNIRPAGVININGTCKAYNRFGEPLIIDDTLCKHMLYDNAMPKPRQIKNTQNHNPVGESLPDIDAIATQSQINDATDQLKPTQLQNNNN